MTLLQQEQHQHQEVDEDRLTTAAARKCHHQHSKDGTRTMLVNLSTKRLDILARLQSYQSGRFSQNNNKASSGPNIRWRFSLPPGLFADEVLNRDTLNYLQSLEDSSEHQHLEDRHVDRNDVAGGGIPPPANLSKRNSLTSFVFGRIKKQEYQQEDIHEVDVDIFSDEFRGSISLFPDINNASSSALYVLTEEFEKDDVKSSRKSCLKRFREKIKIGLFSRRRRSSRAHAKF